MTKSRQVNIHEAKTHLSRLVDEAADGTEIVIARAGKPAARLVALQKRIPTRKPGFLKDRIRIAADFDAPLPDTVLDAFDGAP
jgi:prevent-host-death family protein